MRRAKTRKAAKIAIALAVIAASSVTFPATVAAQATLREAIVTANEEFESRTLDPHSEHHRGVEGEEASVLFRALGVGVYAVNAGDIISTELAISNGYRELNPRAQSRAVRVASHVAVAYGWNWGTERVRKGGHDRVALWMRVAMIVPYGYLTARNLRYWAN